MRILLVSDLHYTLKQFDWVGSVASEYDVVVVAGPQTAFLAPESEALDKFFAGGGRALIMIDPVLPGPGAPPSDLGFRGLAEKYGLKIGDDIVIDPAKKEFRPADFESAKAVDAAQVAAVSLDKVRRFELGGDRLAITYLDAAGKPTAETVWNRTGR